MNFHVGVLNVTWIVKISKPQHEIQQDDNAGYSNTIIICERKLINW